MEKIQRGSQHIDPVANLYLVLWLNFSTLSCQMLPVPKYKYGIFIHEQKTKLIPIWYVLHIKYMYNIATRIKKKQQNIFYNYFLFL